MNKNFFKKLSATRTTNAILLLGIFFIVTNFTSAATPNPGHPWTEVGDGLVQFAAPTGLRTYTLPDQNATLLTTLPFSQGDLLYGTGASTTATLPKDINASRYLSNTGTNNNPAWAQINLTNGVNGVLPSLNGGTGNASTSFTGMTLSRTYTLPDANTTLLTTNAAVTLAQGGTGGTMVADTGGIVYSGASALSLLSSTSTAGTLLMSGASAAPFWSFATYASTSGSYGNVLSSDGKNFVSQGGIPNATNRTMTILSNAAGTTATNLGFPAAPTLTATASNADDATAPWINHATTATIGNSSGVISAAFSYTRSGWSPKFSALIKTDATTIATVGYWIGLFSATPDNATAPNIHAAAFRYYTSVDGTAFWRTVTIAGTGASATVTTTTVPIASNTAYELNIDCTAAINCKFYINGTLVATHIATLPASGTGLGYGARVTALAASARNIKWSRISITQD